MEERLSLDQVLNSEHSLALIETADPDRLLAYFKRITLTTGRAVYDWSPEHGLYRLGIEHIFIPRTRTPADVLSYITSSRHYGIYLLRDFNDSLQKPAVERQLARFIEKNDGVRRLMIMFGQSVAAPQSLRDKFVHVALDQAARQVGA